MSSACSGLVFVAMWTLWMLWLAAWTLSALLPGGCVSGQETVRCLFGSTLCNDGLACVSYNHLCDGETDCADGSDEANCDTVCSMGQFQCAHGKLCVEKQHVCDGVTQCQDRSDELDCLMPEDGCFHRCDKKRCVAAAFVCDGETDCADGSDEADCGAGAADCSGAEFQCRSGQCVSGSVRCDGSPDCRDGSDEEGCVSRVVCVNDQRRCLDQQQCVLQEWLCDGEKDCKDASDEQNCTETALACGEFQWQCVSRTFCVPESWRCDGTMDCSDKSDEAGCEPVSCPPDQFQCSSSECVAPSLLCNGESDCADESDEGGACKTSRCLDQSQCAQDCYSTPNGTRCWCRKGYEPVADVECVDVDECVKTPEVCAHSCVNSNGSYRCACSDGYVLDPDGRSCKIPGEAYLLASIESDMFLLSIRSSTLELLSTEQEAVVSLDYDWTEQKVYWTKPNAVMWTALDGKSAGTLIRGVRAECVAVDWVGRNLYWTDGVERRINAVGLDAFTEEPVVIVDDGVDKLRSLVLLPQTGVMFWSEIAAESHIVRAGMDGSDRLVLVRGPLRWPVGLAVDVLQNRLYWTDEKLQCIGSATLDGDDVKILQLMNTRSPFSIAVFEDVLYWSDSRSRSVHKARTLSGKQQQVLLKQFGQPYGMKVLHPQLQPSVKSPCVLKRCAHMCVLAPGLSAVCKCPNHFLLEADGRTCSKPEDTTFLLLMSNTSISQVYMHSRRSGVGLQDWPQHQTFDLSDLPSVSALDLVPREQSLYVVDGAAASLSVFKVNESSLSRRGTLFKLRKGAIAAMAVDYVTLNVFWSSTDQPGLYVTSADGTHTAPIVAKGLVRSVTLHPPSGRLCFSNSELEGTGTVLECAYMDGGNHVVVWDGAINPVSLSLSEDGTRLYWVDTSLGLIQSVRTDGSEHKELRSEEPLVALTLANSVLVWITKTDSVTCWFSADHQMVTMWFKVKVDVLDIKAFRKPSLNDTNSCSSGNGGCSQLCLAFPGGRTCRCGRGFIASADTSCVPDPRCPSGTKPCLRGDECVPLERFCDAESDCADDSDEICAKDGVFKSADDTQPKVHLNSTAPLPVGPSTPAGPVLIKKMDSGVTVSPRSFRPLVPDSTDAPKSFPPVSTDVKVQGVDSESCGTRMCSGKGACVLLAGGTMCECVLGYGGDHCEVEVGGLMQGPVLYATVGLVVGVIVLGVIVGLVQKKKSANQRRARPMVRETSLRDLSHGAETTLAQQNRTSTDAENPENRSTLPSS